MSKGARILSWVLQVAVAAALIAAAGSKFFGMFPSEALFEVLGVEPGGRYFVAVWELTAGVLLLIPRTAAYGAVLAALGMLGAFFAHAWKLGLFAQFTDPATGQTTTLTWYPSVILLLLAATIVWLRRHQLPGMGRERAGEGGTPTAPPAHGGR